MERTGGRRGSVKQVSKRDCPTDFPVLLSLEGCTVLCKALKKYIEGKQHNERSKKASKQSALVPQSIASILTYLALDYGIEGKNRNTSNRSS